LAAVPLQGVVEYKSLPSGLHNVQRDLVYFFHDRYAGLSAFAKAHAGADQRNALFVAVGAMLPLKDGRLGRAWLHAANLMQLAKCVFKVLHIALSLMPAPHTVRLFMTYLKPNSWNNTGNVTVKTLLNLPVP